MVTVEVEASEVVVVAAMVVVSGFCTMDVQGGGGTV